MIALGGQVLRASVLKETTNLDDAMKDLAMAKILRGRYVVAQELQERNREVHVEPRKPPRSAFYLHHSTLIAATLLVTMTFRAALRPSSELFKAELINSSQTRKQDTPLTDLFVLFNSTAFFSLMVLIITLTYELPLQPWFLFVEFSTVGAYVCSVMIATPHLVTAVLLIGSFILLAAFLKFLGLHKMVHKCFVWLCTKVHSKGKSSASSAAYLPQVNNNHL